MSAQLFYSLCIGFMSGVFLRSFFIIDGYGMACTLLIGCAMYVSWRILTSPKDSVLLIVSVCFCAMAIGVYRMNSVMDTPSVFDAYAGKHVSFDARVVREPEVRNTSVHLYVEPVGLGKTDERVLITTDRFEKTASKIAYGDVLTVTGTIAHPEAFATDGGRSFQYPEYLRVRGVQYLIQHGQVTKLRTGPQSLPRFLFEKKQVFERAIETVIMQPMAGLGEGLLLGVPNALSSNLEQTFRNAGIIHIVVLSGYNVMIVVEMLMYILAFFLRPRLRMIVGAIAIGLFVFVVGASATALRAGVMAILLLVARGTNRTYGVLRALFLTALLMVFINPYLLAHDPGFELSFLATLGLIILSPHIEKRLGWIPERLGLRLIVTATLATQISVLPLLLYQTGLLSLVSLITNMLVLPTVPFAMLFTFCAGAIALVIPFLGTFVGYTASLLLLYIIKVAEVSTALPFSFFSISAFPFWITGIFYFLLGIVFLLWTRPKTTVSESEIDFSTWTLEEDIKTP